MGIGGSPGLGALTMATPKRRAVFLDRDGVLIETAVRNGKPYAITETDPAIVIDGVPEACARLKAAGFLLVLVTNQPDVARGTTSAGFVERTNNTLKAELGLDDVRACCHQASDQCHCRKPKPGMLTDAAAPMAIDLPASIMVGDRWSDVEAGRSAGCKTVLIDRRYDEQPARSPDHVARSLLDAVPWITAVSPENKGYSP